MNIAVGQSVQLSIYPAPTVEGGPPSWSSSDGAIALEVSPDGATALATAVAVGGARITVNQEAAGAGDGSTVLHTATLDLNVVAEPEGTGISILAALPTPPAPPEGETMEAESRRDKRQAERNEQRNEQQAERKSDRHS